MHQRNRSQAVDAIRGIAVLGVLLVHAALLTQQTGALGGLGLLGYRGVQLFYVVSAFTLFLSLDSRQSEYCKWSNFFIRRFFRIAPLLYLAIIGNLLVNGRHGLSNTEIVSGFLFLNELSPHAMNTVAPGGWSVAVESSFYLLVPILFLTIKTLKQSVIFFFSTVLILGGVSFYLAARPQFAGNEWQIYFRLYWLPVELPVFTLGVVAFYAWKARSQWSDSIIPVVAIVIALVLFAIGLSLKVGGLYVSCVPFVVLVVGLSIDPWPLLVNRFTVFIGKISYSMYLMHFFVMFGLERLNIHFAATAAGFAEEYIIILAASTPLCMLTWRYIEQPGIRLGGQWIRYREANRSRAQLALATPSTQAES